MATTFNILQKPPPDEDEKGWYRWYYKVTELLNNSFPLIFGTSPNYSQFEADGTLVMSGNATVWDDMLFDVQNEDTDAHPTAGVLGSAASSATATFANLARRDGILWVITEGPNGGAAGRYVEITFEDIRQVPVMFFTGIYNGSSGHAANLTWVVYNYVTLAWNNLTFTWANATQYTEVAVSVGFTAQHISGTGQVKVGVNHGSTTLVAHNLSLDEVYLIEDNQPQSVVFKGGRVQSFRNTGYDMVHGRVQFRHAYKVASNFYLHCHFTNLQAVIADGETVVFTLSKSFAAINYNFPTETTLTATFTNNAAWRATLTSAQATSILSGTNVLVGSSLIAPGASAISGASLNISSIGLIEIIRSVGTHTGNVGLLYSDFHIEQDTLASRQEFVK